LQGYAGEIVVETFGTADTNINIGHGAKQNTPESTDSVLASSKLPHSAMSFVPDKTLQSMIQSRAERVARNVPQPAS
jgi:hypothetical protein